MVETITPTVAPGDIDARHQLATVVLNERSSDHGLCAVGGSGCMNFLGDDEST